MTDKRNDLDLARFEELLDRHGADPACFAEPDREAALALLSSDARAQRLLADAAALEAALSSLPVVEPSAALRRAVAEIPLRNPRPDVVQALSFLPFRSLWALVPCAVLMLALGAASGAWAEDRALAAGDEAMVSDEPSSDDEALAELTELAFAFELERELAP